MLLIAFKNAIKMEDKICFRLFILLVCTVLCSGCGRDDDSPYIGARDPVVPLLPPDDYQIKISYDVTIYSYTEAVVLSDQIRLTKGEKAMRTPNAAAYHVEVGVSLNGETAAEIRKIDSPDLPNYPANSLGVDVLPEKSQIARVEIANGQTRAFNSVGDVIGSHNVDNAVAALHRQMFESLMEIRPLTAEQMDLAIQAMRETGMEIRSTEIDYLDVWRHTYEDGSATDFILDKKHYVMSGQAHYDTNGQIETQTYFVYSGEPGSPTLESQWFMVYLDAPLSEEKIRIIRHSVFNNFEIKIK